MIQRVPNTAVKLINIPEFVTDSGRLSVFDQADVVPFDIARVFVVRADTGQKRGHHAHRECVQLLTCVNGACDVVCDDGAEHVTFRLNDPGVGLLIPPLVWAEQTYLEKGTVLLVLCDRSYDEMDYLSDYNEFLKWKTKCECK